jgi:hypothetical protein
MKKIFSAYLCYTYHLLTKPCTNLINKNNPMSDEIITPTTNETTETVVAPITEVTLETAPEAVVEPTPESESIAAPAVEETPVTPVTTV